VIDYGIIVLDPEQFASMVQMLDVNVLLERRAAMVSTQSQHTVREKNGGLTQLLALEQSVATPVLCSRKILIGR
jgi:hypothetical protein